MSKQMKIGVGIVVIVIFFGCILTGLAGLVVSRSLRFRAMARPPQRAMQLEVRLLDDDEDGIPDRAVADLPGPADFGRDPGFDSGGHFDRGFPGQGAQLDVQLIDDDEDGVPDRGVLDLPAGPVFEPRFDSPRPFGRGFEPGWDQGRFTGRRFTPFLILGGLFRLAILAVVLAGLVGLGAVLYRHWRKPPSPQTAPEGITPPETEPEAADEQPPVDQEEEAVPDASTEVEPELGTAESEVSEPEEEEPET